MIGRVSTILKLAIAVCLVTCPALASIVYPQIAFGGGYETVLTISNSGASPWVCSPTVKRRAGEAFPIPVKANGTPISEYERWTIPSGATIRFVITGDNTIRSGYLALEPIDGPSEEQIATSLFFRSVDAAGRVTDLTATYPAQPTRKAVFPVDRSASADTGIALLPTYSPNIPGPIRFRLLDQAGATVQETELAYSGHFALMAAEIFDPMPAPFLGSIVIESPTDFYLMVLRVELTGQSVQLTSVPPGRAEPLVDSPIRRMAFRVIDAEYSRAVDRIVAIGSDPDRLYLLDPASNTEQHVDLPAGPYCLSVSPDGQYAAVAHNKSLSYINLAERRVEKQIPTTAEPQDVVLAANGFAYVIPRMYVGGDVHSIQISTGVETLRSDYMSMVALAARVHPGGKRLYFVARDNIVGKFDISGGAASGLAWNYVEHNPWLGAELWISPDGQRILTQGGVVLSASDSPAEDLKTVARLETGITQLSYAEAAGIMAMIPGPTSWSEPVRDDEVRLFGSQSLDFRARWRFPSFLPHREVRSHGKYVFLNNQATKVFVILQADESSGLLSDFGMLVLDRATLEGNVQ